VVKGNGENNIYFLRPHFLIFNDTYPSLLDRSEVLYGYPANRPGLLMPDPLCVVLGLVVLVLLLPPYAVCLSSKMKWIAK